VGRPPADGWNKTGLEKACDVGVGTLDDHLANVVGLGLLVQRDGRFHRPEKTPPLARSLRAALRHTASVPEVQASPLPRRAYKATVTRTLKESTARVTDRHRSALGRALVPGSAPPAMRPDARGDVHHWSLRPKRRQRHCERVMRLGVGVPGQVVGVALGGIGRPFKETRQRLTLSLG